MFRARFAMGFELTSNREQLLRRSFVSQRLRGRDVRPPSSRTATTRTRCMSYRASRRRKAQVSILILQLDSSANRPPYSLSIQGPQEEGPLSLGDPFRCLRLYPGEQQAAQGRRLRRHPSARQEGRCSGGASQQAIGFLAGRFGQQEAQEEVAEGGWCVRCVA